MTRDEFQAWLDQQPSGRFERIDGIVVSMAPERASHNLRKGAARDALRRAVGKAGLAACQVFGAGMTVQVENSDFEPDALLRRGPRLPGDSVKVPPGSLGPAKSASIHRGSSPRWRHSTSIDPPNPPARSVCSWDRGAGGNIAARRTDRVRRFLTRYNDCYRL